MSRAEVGEPGPTDARALLDALLEITAVLGADQERYADASGLSTARMHLLWVVGAGPPRTQRALADALGVTPRTVTGLVDGLERSGHLVRERHPTDRRSYLVVPTATGRAATEHLREEHRRLADQLFGDLTAADAAVLDRVLGGVVGRLRYLVESPVPPPETGEPR